MMNDILIQIIQNWETGKKRVTACPPTLETSLIDSLGTSIFDTLLLFMRTVYNCISADANC